VGASDAPTGTNTNNAGEKLNMRLPGLCTYKTKPDLKLIFVSVFPGFDTVYMFSYE